MKKIEGYMYFYFQYVIYMFGTNDVASSLIYLSYLKENELM
jgi:hypothetical protein